MHSNTELIKRFYEAFQKGDYATMQSCYHDAATFSDPVFTHLTSSEVKAMWQMLLTSAKGLKVEFNRVESNELTGSCHWDAWYTFSRTGRPVHNVIVASMEFKDGKIFRHRDHFSFWQWSRQALGTSGALLGWSPLIKAKVRSAARKGLNRFVQEQGKVL